MAKYYSMKAPNGSTASVHEDYIQEYKDKGYAWIGEWSGASGAEDIAAWEAYKNSKGSSYNISSSKDTSGTVAASTLESNTTTGLANASKTVAASGSALSSLFSGGGTTEDSILKYVAIGALGLFILSVVRGR